ncbi:phosphotransferase enzyme family protein [Dethiothermospora halolimnae]|uniref:phosphotransferase enzyme family protein n=1 Tax=Dethiothermospora halolimnae TaxID=3114390 RepID=UPI003CCBE407
MNLKTIVNKNWNIGEVKSIEKIDSFTGRVKKVFTNNKEIYILKEKENITSLMKESKLLRYLKECNMPVAAPLVTKNNSVYYCQDNKYYCLYPMLTGKDYFSNPEKVGVYALGNSIAKLHLNLSNYSLIGDYSDLDLLNTVLKWAKKIINEHKEYFDLEFINEVMDFFNINFRKLYNILPKHLIHRDIHPGNMIFKNNILSGIFDFEMVVNGVPIFDPCYCASSILVSKFEQKDKRLDWCTRLVELLKGYNEEVSLTKDELESIIFILFSIQIIFMAFSCNIDNIDAAKYNQKVLKWLYKNKEQIRKNVLSII